MKKGLILVLLGVVLSGLPIPHTVQAGVSVLGTVAVPLADFGDDHNPGFGVTAKLLKSSLPFLSIGPTVGYLQFSGKDVRVSGNIFGTLTTVSGPTLKVIPILLTAQLQPPIPGLKPYVNASAGIYNLSADALMVSSNPLPVIPEASETRFGVAPGAGLLMGLVPGLMSIEVHVAYHLIFTKVSKTTFFGIYAGVNIGLL